MEKNKTELEEAVRELLEFMEENNICDSHEICWLTDEDCYIESNRSSEMSELIQKITESLEE
jgi:hypothetical protein